ncbi:hypothetical protein K8Q96_01665 [Candidatus Nomurabacteria bacterium]|nr:hypothetical protein [Candidatus Nomurabacteria bacterium]
MLEENILMEPPLFECNAEKLSIWEIMKTKKVVSMKILCLEKEKSLPWKWLDSKLKRIKTYVFIQKSKEITIDDSNGISLYFEKITSTCRARFWNSEEFHKLGDDIDEDSLTKRYIFALIAPYELIFHIGNLKELKWLDDPKYIQDNKDYLTENYW